MNEIIKLLNANSSVVIRTNRTESSNSKENYLALSHFDRTRNYERVSESLLKRKIRSAKFKVNCEFTLISRFA